MSKSDDVIGVANTSVGYNFSEVVNNNSRDVYRYTQNPVYTIGYVSKLFYTEGEQINADIGGVFVNAEQFSAKNLPDGVTIDAETGNITGSAAEGTSANSPFEVVVTATDKQSRTDTTTFFMEITQPAQTNTEETPAE